MCLPLKCLKTVVIFFATITILAAVAAIVVGIIEMTQDASAFWKNTDWTTYVYGPAFLVALGVLILILGICGVVGAAKKNGCCITIYNLGNIPLSVGFIILGIVAAVIISDHSGALQHFAENPIDCIQGKYNGHTFSWVSDTEIYFQKANNIFGDANHAIYVGGNPQSDFYKFMDTLTPIKNIVHDSSQGKSNVISYITPVGPEVGQQAMLLFFEETLKCSGMCIPQQYFIFSDVNRGFTKGRDKNSCVYYVKEFFSKFGTAVLGTTFGVGSILLINSILSFCICCHPKKRNKGGNFYQRMSYTEDD